MPKTLHHFLLIYSYAESRLVSEPQMFTDEFEAAAAYTRAEASYRDVLENFEIVLVGSDSLDTIMKTHGHYFSSEGSRAPFGAHPQPV